MAHKNASGDIQAQYNMAHKNASRTNKLNSQIQKTYKNASGDNQINKTKANKNAYGNKSREQIKFKITLHTQLEKSEEKLQ